MTEDTNDKVRAVFLAALMALSMVAMGAAAIGGGAAATVNDDPGVHAPNDEVTHVENVQIITGTFTAAQTGKTIFEDFPKNGSDVFNGVPAVLASTPAGTGPILGKELGGQHMGLAGLPTQTDEYEALDQGNWMNYQQARLNDPGVDDWALPRQDFLLEWDIVADEDVDTETVRLDYDHAAESGLQVNVSATNALYNQTLGHEDLRAYVEAQVGADHFGTNGSADNEIQDITIDNAANEVAIEYLNRVNASVRDLEITLVWEPQDSVEGLDIENDLDERIDLIFRGPAQDTETAAFRLVNNGATAVTPGDAGALLNSDTAADNTEELDAEEEADGVAQGTTSAMAFHIWNGQTITFAMDSPDQRVRVHEAVMSTNDQDEDIWVRGDKVYDERGLPGQAVTMDSSNLDVDTQYVVSFGDTLDDSVAVLDVQALDVQASAPEQVVATDDLEIQVTSEDTTGNEVEAWFLEAGDTDIGEVIHVESRELDGTGETTLRVSPEGDLGAEEGATVYAWIVHPESETVVSTQTIDIVAAEEARVTINSPTSEQQFARGDIVPIELSFENTQRGTITLGDRDAHNVEINATVRDTDESGTATVYVNTFQVGHGYLWDEDGNYEVNNATAAGWESRNHGFFTHPDDDGSALVGDEGQSAIAHPDIAITGGSNGGAVMSGAYAYDLSSVAGEQPFTAAGVLDDRKQVNVVPRGEGDMNLWTAPGAGVNAIDPETVDDIEAGVEAGYISPAGEVIARNDFIVMEIQTDGLTGVLHEAIVRDTQSDVDVADLFDREDDTIITDIWNLNPPGYTLSALAVAQDIPDNFEELAVPIGRDKVVAGGGDINYDTFYLPALMEEGEALPDQELELPIDFQAVFELTVSGGAGDNTPNDVLSGGASDALPFTFEEASANIDKQRIQYDAVNERVEVPRQANVTLPGITNVAAGTNLTVQVNSKAGQGEGSAFFDLQTNIIPYFDENRSTQLWEVVNEDDFADAQPGLEFEIKVRRQGAAGNLNPAPAIDGIVLEDPVVDQLAFGDQKSLGDTVQVETVETNQGGFVVISDADGNELGRTNRLAAGEVHSNVAVSLDDTLADGNHTLTATVYRAEGEMYPEGQASATIQVGTEEPTLPANFQVSGISPEQTEIAEPGESLTVEATITNNGDEEATQNIVFRFNGNNVGQESVTLAGGESTTVSFDADTSGLEFSSSAVYSISSDDGSLSGSVSVGEDPDADTEDTEDQPTDQEDGNATDAEDGDDGDGAGFGIVVAALAMLGAALIAIRRQTE